jgi:Putative zinc-finger
MSVIPLGPKQCEMTRKYLDSYVDNELLVETNYQVLKHLESCKDCSEALQVRLRVKNHLREAVRGEAVPAALWERIQRKLREDESHVRPVASWTRWSLAAAALLVLCFGGWGVLHLLQFSGGSGLPSRLAQGQSVSDRVRAILNIGVEDHVQCAIDEQFAKESYTPEQMAKEMGPDYMGLVPFLTDKLPQDYKVPAAHKCEVNGREFVHLILKNQEGFLSLIITKKAGVSFPAQDPLVKPDSRGVGLHQDRLDGLQVAGFETREHLAFVVSGLGQMENSQIAAGLAPHVSGFLAKLEI